MHYTGVYLTLYNYGLILGNILSVEFQRIRETTNLVNSFRKTQVYEVEDR